ncbi:uncharacterized protein EV422DRAFT_565200 [Fimicolochytrium jonesii]|uniref:uncharacterized protein n=1 Tax=Fimicolochytrium jonesii TaxID=1396493 RepID=UPI0022FE0382|nr:uncharacterized protein EV422DRAFT_565200 [Fimicolochytrium jonesii]KAI8824513.1 hypothetical protein EV422DRAFT_565200 [Fimicolochytrium jonesii]
MSNHNSLPFSQVELTQWVDGVAAFENGDFEAALDVFEPIADTARIHFNIGMTFINLNALEDAISALTRAVACDPFLAVAYYMRGVCFYNLNALNESLADFGEAITYLRGNAFIDYNQLGLAYKLHACEILFNRGLVLAAMNRMEDAYREFQEALKSRPQDGKVTFGNIEEAPRMGSRAPQYLGPYAVPPDTLYRPPSGKVKNSEKKDYIGKAKVVASVEATDNYAGFSGRELKLKTLPRSNSTTDIPTTGVNGRAMADPLARSNTTIVRPVRANTTTGVLVRSGTVNQPQRLVAGGVAPSSISQQQPQSAETGVYRSRSTSLGSSASPVPGPIRRAATVTNIQPQRGTRAISINPIDELMSELSIDEQDERDDRGSYTDNNDRYREDDRRNGGPSRYSPGNQVNTTTINVNRRMMESYDRSVTASPVSSMGSIHTVADKIKLKAHFRGTTRIILIPTTLQLPDLMTRLCEKFCLPPSNNRPPLRLMYADEDGTMVTIMDQEDLEVAWNVQGIEWGDGGRIELWCEA